MMLRTIITRKLVWTMAAVAICSGCAFNEPEFCYLIKESLSFHPRIDRRHTYRKHRNQALDVWHSQCASSAPKLFGDDYKIGFVDGYADYMNLGGCGEPPIVPPARYWKYHYRTPQGRRAVAAYFDGFRHGARLAMAHGDGRLVTTPWPCEIGSDLVGCQHLKSTYAGGAGAGGRQYITDAIPQSVETIQESDDTVRESVEVMPESASELMPAPLPPSSRPIETARIESPRIEPPRRKKSPPLDANASHIETFVNQPNPFRDKPKPEQNGSIAP